jgi:hypothetical protein
MKFQKNLISTSKLVIHVVYWFCGPCFDSFKFVSHLVLSVHLSCFLLICGQYLIQSSVDSFRFGWDLAQVSVCRFWFWLAKLNVQGLGVRCVQCFSMQFIQFCYSLPQFLCLSIFGLSRFVCSVLYLEIVLFCSFNKSPWAVVLDQMIHIPLPFDTLISPDSFMLLQRIHAKLQATWITGIDRTRWILELFDLMF